MSKLEKIITFIDIVEENSFAGAARKQKISTAAISKQLSLLEDELGTQLLKRTTRQITLTEIGAQYYEQCKKVLVELQEAENAIAGSQREATGILRITCNRHFSFHKIIPRLPEFIAQNPKLQINFEIAERFPDLAHEKIDIVYGVTIEGPPDLVRRRVDHTRYVLCASPGYLSKHGTPNSPNDLHKHLYISHSMRKPMDMLSFADGKEIYVQPFLLLNDTHAMRECALNDMGIIKLHDYEVADALKAGSLIELLPEYKSPKIPIYLYYQKSRYLLPKIRRFIDFYVV